MTERCWNCGSANYINVAVKEECPSCGIFCCYRGGGPNETYNRASDKRHREAEEDRQKQYEEDWFETYGEPYNNY